MINRLGFGTWGIGGDAGPLSGYGPTDDEVSKLAIDAAVAGGVRLFDTAPPYGDGKSEVLLGEVLRRTGRPNVDILTKVGVNTWSDVPRYDPDFVISSISSSLNRLGMNVIHGVIFHSLKQIETDKISEGYYALLNLKNRGLVKKIGFSLKSPDDFLILKNVFREIDLIELNFNMLDLRALDPRIQGAIEDSGVNVIARTPFAFGYLTDAISPDTKFHVSDHRDRWPMEQRLRWIKARESIKAIAASRDVDDDISALALRFILSFSFVSTVIPGMMTPAEVEKNIASVSKGPLPPGLVEEIIKFNDIHQVFEK